ncbi:MAG: hypothetical protein L2C94_007285 [Aigarchaeota archaeon]|nr:hypothetical protein [Candidatus Wolframiiraptor gerlachensis]
MITRSSSELISASAVKGERHSKDKPFTEHGYGAAVGRAVIESFRERTGVGGSGLTLDNPDVQLYCLIRGLGAPDRPRHDRESLHRRYYRVYHHRAALQPRHSRGHVNASGWRREEALLDPMCGGGTIPIEAALMAPQDTSGCTKAQRPSSKQAQVHRWGEDKGDRGGA